MRDLREWIALLEREGELVRVSAEVDPDLEVTEIVDRTVKAGGPALLFEKPKGSSHPLLINQFGTERRMCLAFGVERLDDLGTRVSDVLEMQPPQGLVEKVRGLKKLKSLADSMPKTVRSGPVPGGRARGRRGRSLAAAGPALLAGRPGAVRHPAGRDHEGPAHRRPQRRHVPDAGARARARPRCTGRSTRTGGWTTSRPTAGSRSRSRSASTRSPPTRRARRSRSTWTSS